MVKVIYLTEDYTPVKVTNPGDRRAAFRQRYQWTPGGKSVQLTDFDQRADDGGWTPVNSPGPVWITWQDLDPMINEALVRPWLSNPSLRS